MPSIQLQFFGHKNSYTLQLLNLEALDVSQIKTLEKFTQERRGIFDFDKQRISIQKRVEREDVEKLLRLLGIDVIFVEKSTAQTTKAKEPPLPKVDAKIPFGKYKGNLYCDLPKEYLHWLSKNYNGAENSNIAQELALRS